MNAILEAARKRQAQQAEKNPSEQGKDNTNKADENTKAPKDETPKVTSVVEDNAQEPEYIYATPMSDAFTMQLSDGSITAKNGNVKVNASQHAEIQKLIKSGRPDISQNMVLLDPEAAEQIAKEYLARNRPHALKGMLGSEGSSFREIKHGGDLSTETNANRQAAQAENLRKLNVQEEGVIHAEDQKVDPEGNNAAVDQK